MVRSGLPLSTATWQTVCHALAEPTVRQTTKNDRLSHRLSAQISLPEKWLATSGVLAKLLLPLMIERRE
jgi:hypothetical protein